MSRNAETTLRTARLVLRGPRQDDLGALFAIYGDRRAMRFWSTAPHADKSVTQHRLDRQIAAFAVRPCYFVITCDGAVIGNVGMVHDNEVGFILHPDHWRKGLAKEAMQALIPSLWALTGVATLIADVDPRNAASIGLLSSLGFVETHRASKTFCIDGVWSDSLYFSLRHPDTNG